MPKQWLKVQQLSEPGQHWTHDLAGPVKFARTSLSFLVCFAGVCLSERRAGIWNPGGDLSKQTQVSASDLGIRGGARWAAQSCLLGGSGMVPHQVFLYSLEVLFSSSFHPPVCSASQFLKLRVLPPRPFNPAALGLLHSSRDPLSHTLPLETHSANYSVDSGLIHCGTSNKLLTSPRGPLLFRLSVSCKGERTSTFVEHCARLFTGTVSSNPHKSPMELTPLPPCFIVGETKAQSSPFRALAAAKWQRSN